MRGIVFTAIFTAALLLGSAHAQMRGGFAGHGGGVRGGFAGPAGGVRGGFVGRAPMTPGGMPTVGVRAGFPTGTVRVRSGFGGFNNFGFNRVGFCRFGRCVAPTFFPGGFHHRRAFFGFGFGGFGAFPFVSNWYGGWPYYGGPVGYSGYSDYSMGSDYALADRERLMNDLEDQRRSTEELRVELADLQAAANAAAQTATRPPAPPAAPAAPVANSGEQSLATTLVFRDNRHLEVQNYAIVGDKLYEFGPHWKRTIAISDLDLPATMKANEDRGIRFALPTKSAKRQ